mgnify:CR=1 FL=1
MVYILSFYLFILLKKDFINFTKKGVQECALF